jgi:hypothetical protein
MALREDLRLGWDHLIENPLIKKGITYWNESDRARKFGIGAIGGLCLLIGTVSLSSKESVDLPVQPSNSVSEQPRVGTTTSWPLENVRERVVCDPLILEYNQKLERAYQLAAGELEGNLDLSLEEERAFIRWVGFNSMVLRDSHNYELSIDRDEDKNISLRLDDYTSSDFKPRFMPAYVLDAYINHKSKKVDR